jgi:hypothetical protein
VKGTSVSPCREAQKELAERHGEAADTARQARNAAESARLRVERLQREFEEEERGIQAGPSPVRQTLNHIFPVAALVFSASF